MQTFRKTWNHKRIEDAGSVMSKEANSFVKAFKNLIDIYRSKKDKECK